MTLISPKILLLSIQQKYASLIFNGDKKVELRRVRPRNLKEGDLILVYVTSPEKALTGILEVEKIIEMSPKELWHIVKEKAGIDSDDFKSYFKNLDRGFAIFVKNAHIFPAPIGLEELQSRWQSFRPPQCYHYLNENEVKILSDQFSLDVLSIANNEKFYQTELADILSN
jgi:predicted transcriptional regulator